MKRTFYVSKTRGGRIDLMVDGTIPGATAKWHFDHHRKGGAPVQLDEIPFGVAAEATSIGTTMLDADAVVAAVWAVGFNQPNKDKFESALMHLKCLAWACDHLHVPTHISPYKSMENWALDTIQGLKDQTAKRAKAEGITLFGPNKSDEATIDAFMNQEFEHQFNLIMAACKGDLYWENLPKSDFSASIEKQMESLKGRIGGYNQMVVDLRGIKGYVNPLAYYRLIPSVPLVIVQRDCQHEGKNAYTVGVNPLAGQDLDLTGLLVKLQELEPGWGGRSTVFGSPYEGSKLSVTDLIGIIAEYERS